MQKRGSVELEGTTMKNTTAKRHIETLISHGAKLSADGERMSLTMEFYENAVKRCKKLKINAATFELVLPGIEEIMGLTIWSDGHADSGSMENIRRCLDAR